MRVDYLHQLPKTLSPAQEHFSHVVNARHGADHHYTGDCNGSFLLFSGAAPYFVLLGAPYFVGFLNKCGCCAVGLLLGIGSGSLGTALRELIRYCLLSIRALTGTNTNGRTNVATDGRPDVAGVRSALPLPSAAAALLLEKSRGRLGSGRRTRL